MGYTIPKPNKATLISPYEADADYTPTPLMRFQIEQVNGRPGLGSYANPLLYMNRTVAQHHLRVEVLAMLAEVRHASPPSLCLPSTTAIMRISTATAS